MVAGLSTLLWELAFCRAALLSLVAWQLKLSADAACALYPTFMRLNQYITYLMSAKKLANSYCSLY